jgi:hypothetical protein
MLGLLILVCWMPGRSQVVSKTNIEDLAFTIHEYPFTCIAIYSKYTSIQVYKYWILYNVDAGQPATGLNQTRQRLRE